MGRKDFSPSNSFLIHSYIQQTCVEHLPCGRVCWTLDGVMRKQPPWETMRAAVGRVRVDGMGSRVGGAAGGWRELVEGKLTKWGRKGGRAVSRAVLQVTGNFKRLRRQEMYMLDLF